MATQDDIKEMIAGFKKGPSDVVGIDVEDSETRVVRMRKSADSISVLSADILPPIKGADSAPGGTEDIDPLNLPSKLKGKYASIAVSGKDSVIKLLSFPGHFDAKAESKVVDSMGLEDPDRYRVSYKLTSEGHGKTETRLLAVALDDNEASITTKLFPAGLPAPYSIELAGLSSMTSFLHSRSEQHNNDAVGVIDFRSTNSTFAIFNKNALALIRTFNIGSDSLLEKVQVSLGVDKDTAQGIISDGSFDISQAVTDVMEPLIKQMIVSRDFVERREDCNISKIYASGGLVASRDCQDEMHSSIGVDIDTWDPFDNLTIAPDALPEAIQGAKWRFSAAIGSAIGTFEES